MRFTYTGATKLLRNPPPQSPPPAIAVVQPDAGDLDAGFEATNLCFTAIERGPNSTALLFAWSPDTRPPLDRVGLFSALELPGPWTHLFDVDISTCVSNALVEVTDAEIATNSPPTAFFRLGDPAPPDADGDGFSDVEEIGEITVRDEFEWHDTTGFTTVYGEPPPAYWFGEDLLGLTVGLPGSSVVQGIALTGLSAFENGFVGFRTSGDWNVGVVPYRPYSLSYRAFLPASIMVAPYWGGGRVQYGNTNSYMRAGTLADGTAVVEFHDVKRDRWSSDGMTYQVIIPGGTGDVVRVSYQSSDIFLDGSNVVVGVQNARRTLPGGMVYSLEWDFAERGPILPGTTVEYRLGTGTDPDSDDSDNDGASDWTELYEAGTDPWNPDTDGDALSDGDEMAWGTDPYVTDTDGDGLPDAWEVTNGLDPTSGVGDDGASGDPDGDGLTNAQERQLGTDTLLPDTDGDGVSDGAEVLAGTDPLVSDEDSDGDGVPDWREWEIGTDAYAADTDGDGIADGVELLAGTNPLSEDTDGDGLGDAVESVVGTDPLQPDSDGDGMPDGWEHAHGFDPLTNNAQTARTDDDANADPDGDGLTNLQESEWGTNPSGADANGDGKPDGRDSDGDGVDDGVEIAQVSDPADASDGGESNSCVAVAFYFGDPSDSQSEKYRLSLCPVGGDAANRPRAYSMVNSYYGACETKTAHLRRGWTYEVTLSHAGTNLSSPDYDYTLSTTPPEGVTLDDPDGLFATDVESDSNFSAAGKVATLTVDPLPPVATGVLGVNIVLDDNVILFEDSYTNAPGEVVARQSTWTRVSAYFAAGSGAASGTFSVTRGGERIRLHAATRNGTVVADPQPVNIPAQGVQRLVFYAEGLNASTNMNDVTFHAEVTGGGNTVSDEKSLTVGRLTVEAVSKFPTNRARHVYGPLEETNLLIIPQILFDSTTMTGTIPYNGSFTRTPTNYLLKVSNRRIRFPVTVKVGNMELTVEFSVIEPNEELRVISYGALPPQYWTDHLDLPIPQVGDIGVALQIKLYLEPSYVSFHCLTVEELFAPAVNIQGCFTNFPHGSLDHDTTAGAGEWRRVADDNWVGFDCPAYFDLDHRLSDCEGEFSYNIPMIWYTYDGFMTNYLKTASQKTMVWSNGDMVVRKYGFWARRKKDNTAKPIITGVDR